MFDGVNGVDAFENVLYRIVFRVFAGFERQAFVSHILQGNDLLTDFSLCKFASVYGFVFGVIGAIDTSVDAIVGQIERSEHDDAVAVEFLFDFLGKFKGLFVEFRVVTFKQESRFTVGESFAFGCLFENSFYKLFVVLMFTGIMDGVDDFVVADKFFCFVG